MSNRFCWQLASGNENSAIAEGSRDGLTSARCCNYCCMCSWWWVGSPPETCRASILQKYNKLYIVASCWTVIDNDSRCTDPWTRNLLNLHICRVNLIVYSLFPFYCVRPPPPRLWSVVLYLFRSEEEESRNLLWSSSCMLDKDQSVSLYGHFLVASCFTTVVTISFPTPINNKRSCRATRLAKWNLMNRRTMCLFRNYVTTCKEHTHAK
jgi:hypothetical protein